VDAVTTDTEVTAAYVLPFNPRCTVVPDPSQVEEFDRRRAELARKPADRVVLGWLGSPHTAFNLFEIREALEELFRRHDNLHLRLVGTGGDTRLIPPFEGVRYSCRDSYDREQMIEEVFGMDVGLYPLQDEERCRVRGIGKAELYMSGEAAVVASPVGENRTFIRDGVNGLLAGTAAEWVEKLDRLVRDADLRRRLAAAGLATVRAAYRIEHSFARLEAVLRGEGVAA
jgi:glycosyltransferase involved in cell wall biosynthesis